VPRRRITAIAIAAAGDERRRIVRTQFLSKALSDVGPVPHAVSFAGEQGLTLLTKEEVEHVAAAGSKPGVAGGANRQAQ
jgi:hypothetical protein